MKYAICLPKVTLFVQTLYIACRGGGGGCAPPFMGIFFLLVTLLINHMDVLNDNYITVNALSL